MRLSIVFSSVLLLSGCPDLELGDPGSTIGTAASVDLTAGNLVVDDEVGAEQPDGTLDEIDIYRIDQAPGHRIRVRRTTGEVDLSLLDGDGGEIRRMDHGLDDLMEYGSESGGQVYLQVTSASNEPAFYTLEIFTDQAGQGEDEQEPNNSADQASDLGTLSEPITRSGKMDIEADRQDWFVITLVQEANLDIGWSRTEDPAGRFDLRVLDHGSGAVIDVDEGVSGQESGLTLDAAQLSGVDQLAIHLLWDAGEDPRYGADAQLGYVLTLATQ